MATTSIPVLKINAPSSSRSSAKPCAACRSSCARSSKGRAAHSGAAAAFLHVLPQNARAIRFYEKADWQILGLEPVTLKTPEGPLTLDLLRMERWL